MIDDSAEFKPCIVIPCYRHASLLLENLDLIVSFQIPLIIVEDSGQDAEIIKDGILKFPGIVLLCHRENLGKGAALLTGFKEATRLGFTHAIQVDADGQHNYNDIPLFIEKAKAHPKKLILGTPIFDESAPLERIWGRKISTFLVAIETMSLSAHDVLFGFRVYPLKSTCHIIEKYPLDVRMGFDVQCVIYHLWEGVKIENIRTPVKYGSNIGSNFRYVEDNLSFIVTHAKILMYAPFMGLRGLFKRMN